MKRVRTILGMMGTFTILIMVYFHGCTYVKTYQIVHFKYLYIIVYQLNLNKADTYIIYMYIYVHTHSHPYISRFMRLLTVRL